MMKEEQGLLIQQKKLRMQQELNPWLQGERPAPKPLNNEDLYILRASFSHLAELATSQFWLNLHHYRRPKKVCKPYLWTWCHHQALVFPLTVAPKRRFLSHWM
jgi:hypothetical protein